MGKKDLNTMLPGFNNDFVTVPIGIIPLLFSRNYNLSKPIQVPVDNNLQNSQEAPSAS